MTDLLRKEPLAVIGTFAAAIGSIIGVLVSFNVPLTDAQQSAITVAIVPVGILIVVLVTRQMVTPNGAVVEHEVDGQVIAGEASELPTGRRIRQAGSLVDSRRALDEDEPIQ